MLSHAMTSQVPAAPLLIPAAPRSARLTITPLEPDLRETSAAAAILDRSPTACFLLSAAGLLLYRNAAAEPFLGRSGGLCIRDGHLQLVDAWKRRLFRDRLATVADTISREPYAALAVETPCGTQQLHLVITRLEPGPASRWEPRLLVTVTNPEAAAEVPPAVLRQLYGFTPAEVHIANALLAGLSLEEVAESRHVSVATVRSQLKALLEKTGTTRQSTLVRLLSSLSGSIPMPVSQPAQQGQLRAFDKHSATAPERHRV